MVEGKNVIVNEGWTGPGRCDVTVTPLIPKRWTAYRYRFKRKV